MMFRALSTSVLVLLAAFQASGQPEWLREASRSAPTDTGFTREATALVLHSSASLAISSGGQSKTQYRTAYRILTSAGERFATLKEPLSPWRSVRDLEGWVISADGKSTELDRGTVVEYTPNETAAYYDDSRWLVAALPNVHVGDVVGFQYSVEEEGISCPFQHFVLQVQEPVVCAQVTVEIPSGWRLHSATWRTEVCSFEQKGNVYTWTARNLTRQPDEPLMPSWSYLRREILISASNPGDSSGEQFSGWNTVARWFEHMHRPASVPDAALISFTHSLTDSLPTRVRKLVAIAAFVREQIRYVAVEIGKERWQPRPAPATFVNRYGDCKDKADLLRAMLRVVRIPSVPVLVNTAASVREEVPSPFQFDHCIVAVPLDSLESAPELSGAAIGGLLFIDPTDPSGSLRMVPPSLEGGCALLATASDTSLTCAPETHDRSRKYSADVTLLPDGSLSATVTVTDYGSWAQATRHSHQTTLQEKEIEAWQTHLGKILPGAAISDYKSSSSEDSTRITFRLKSEHYAVSLGRSFLVKLDLLHASDPPDLVKEKRINPVWFGPQERVETGITWHLPPGWAVESGTAPPPAGASCRGGSITCEISSSANTVQFRSVREYLGKLVSQAEYQRARTFSQQLSAVAGASIVVHQP